MISALNSLSVSGGVVVADISVTLTPSIIATRVPNGTYTTATVTSAVGGGTAPYTYEWSTDSGILTINTPDQSSTNFTLSGVNRERVETAALKVTDSSNPAKIATRSVNLFIQFGEAL